jgi:nickel superoxide dismutase
MKRLIAIPFAFFLLMAASAPAGAHCEIPCGIYGDNLRFDLLAEHITTIEKSMKQIVALSKATKGKDRDENQLIRWVVNKEEHANKLQHIVFQYFMNQRIKPAKEGTKAYKKYIQQITLAHQLLIGAMKAKQTTDLVVIANLRAALSSFKKAYQG